MARNKVKLDACISEYEDFSLFNFMIRLKEHIHAAAAFLYHGLFWRCAKHFSVGLSQVDFSSEHLPEERSRSKMIHMAVGENDPFYILGTESHLPDAMNQHGFRAAVSRVKQQKAVSCIHKMDA